MTEQVYLSRRLEGVKSQLLRAEEGVGMSDLGVPS